MLLRNILSVTQVCTHHFRTCGGHMVDSRISSATNLAETGCFKRQTSPGFLAASLRWTLGRSHGRRFVPGTTSWPSGTTAGRTRSRAGLPPTRRSTALLSRRWTSCRRAQLGPRAAKPAAPREKQGKLTSVGRLDWLTASVICFYFGHPDSSTVP